MVNKYGRSITHQSVVEEAIKQRKPVPVKVLRDYQGLAMSGTSKKARGRYWIKGAINRVFQSKGSSLRGMRNAQERRL